MAKNNQEMNDLIRGKKPTQTTEPEGISQDQENRILEYIDKGASYTEARNLVLGEMSGAKLNTPPGNAGAGMSTQAPKGKISMDEFIRAITGRIKWTR